MGFVGVVGRCHKKERSSSSSGAPERSPSLLICSITKPKAASRSAFRVTVEPDLILTSYF